LGLIPAAIRRGSSGATDLPARVAARDPAPSDQSRLGISVDRNSRCHGQGPSATTGRDTTASPGLVRGRGSPRRFLGDLAALCDTQTRRSAKGAESAAVTGRDGVAAEGSPRWRGIYSPRINNLQLFDQRIRPSSHIGRQRRGRRRGDWSGRKMGKR
jgi:hypothetical protein